MAAHEERGDDEGRGGDGEHHAEDAAQRPADEHPRQILLGILHFAADEAHIRPAIIDPQHRDEREPETREGEASGWSGRCEVTTRLRQSERERENDEKKKRARLRDRRQVLYERSPLHSHVVERRQKKDCSGRDVMDVFTVGRDSGVVAKNANEVFRERRGYRAECRGTYENQLGPTEEKRGKPAPRFANEDVHSARARESAADLGKSERPTQSEESTGQPDRKQGKWTGKLVGDACGRAKNARADGRADENRYGAPQAETAWQRRISRKIRLRHAETVVQRHSVRE